MIAAHPRIGMKVAIADVNEDGLRETGAQVAAIVGDANVLVVPTDVSDIAQVRAFRDRVYEAWGEVRRRHPRLWLLMRAHHDDQVAVLLNNAGIGLKGTSWDGLDNWHKIFDVNLFGCVSYLFLS